MILRFMITHRLTASVLHSMGRTAQQQHLLAVQNHGTQTPYRTRHLFINVRLQGFWSVVSRAYLLSVMSYSCCRHGEISVPAASSSASL